MGWVEVDEVSVHKNRLHLLFILVLKKRTQGVEVYVLVVDKCDRGKCNRVLCIVVGCNGAINGWCFIS